MFSGGGRRAGLGAPAGDAAPGESPDRAALRIARQQTGLISLQIRAALGQRFQPLPDRDRPRRASYYHLRHLGAPPDRWPHVDERSSGDGTSPRRYDLFWVSLPDGLPRLALGHEAFLGILLRSLATEKE